jgi:hypothetical protein
MMIMMTTMVVVAVAVALHAYILSYRTYAP